MKLNDLDPLLHVSASQVGPYLRSTGKRLFDIAFSLSVILLTMPIWLVLCLLVSLDGGPVFYSQKRIGRNGVPFNCWKFRTMSVNAEEALRQLIQSNPEIAREWHATQKLKVDPRVTRLGRWLRRTSVDELPQFFNVLNGTMSVVGPRPFAQDQVMLYHPVVLSKYIAVKPGLTGYWQVYARHDTTFECRARFDQIYVDKASFASDLALVIKTPLAMLRGS
ncbi:MAG TPA: sugar transferase [Limnobacter sp.]|nr:sugar transferase [Limnobacter sp.]